MFAQHASPGILVLAFLTLLPVFWMMRRALKGDDLFVRRLPGVDALNDACARSAELGKSMIFTFGLTGLGPLYYACLGALISIARKAAQLRARLLLPQNDPQVMAVTEATIRQVYRDEGRGAAFDPKTLVFLSGEQFAFAAGYIGMVQREKVGAAFLFGNFAAESLILAEAGQQVGAMQIAATVTPEQVAFFVCACDYTLIGEELFAASAYVTREPIQMGSLVGQDYAKIVYFTIIILGVCIATWNEISPNNKIKSLEKIVFTSWSELLDERPSENP